MIKEITYGHRLDGRRRQRDLRRWRPQRKELRKTKRIKS